MTKRYSQRVYLFAIYGVFTLTLLIIFFLYTYQSSYQGALDDAARDLDNVCASITNAVEIQLDNMSTISMNIAYSNLVRDNFKEFTSLTEEIEEDPQALILSREKITMICGIINAMIGAYQSASDIRLYTMDGICAEVGFRQRTKDVKLEDFAWYEPTVSLSGHKYIGNPEIHKELPSNFGDQHDPLFISMTRIFRNSAGSNQGIIEVVQEYSKIFALPDQLSKSNPQYQILIYNDRSEQIYPYKQEEKAVDKSISDKTELISSMQIPNYDWTITVLMSQETIMNKLADFQQGFMWIMFISIIVTLLLCMYISGELTKPLLKLTQATGKITINRVLDEKKVNLTSADSHIREISQLCESIRDMYEKLRTTSQEVLLSHSEETRAKLQATQSLINPHFLYNCLTNISIMAEEEMNEDITRMCEALCDYFRYISSSRDMVVTIEDEIHSTGRYLDCMKLRFDQELEVTIDCADNVRHFVIPKLILQPIVENAFKYAFCISPPWELQIQAYQEDDHWYLTVQDNGGTMSEEKIQELLDLYRNLDLNEELKSMQIGGMGLKNVYLRLKLLYGDQAIFGISREEPGYTRFVLGGPIYHNKEEYYAEHPQL